MPSRLQTTPHITLSPGVVAVRRLQPLLHTRRPRTRQPCPMSLPVRGGSPVLRDSECHAERACVQGGEDGRQRVAVQPVHGALLRPLEVIRRCFRTHLVHSRRRAWCRPDRVVSKTFRVGVKTRDGAEHGEKRNQVESEMSETQPPRTRTFVSVTARVKSLCHRPQIIKSASLVAAALQRAEQRAKLLKELVPPADLPGLRFREGQRLADGVEHAVQPWG